MRRTMQALAIFFGVAGIACCWTFLLYQSDARLFWPAVIFAVAGELTISAGGFRKRLRAIAIAAALLPGVASAERIAWTADGNFHDKDDWGSTPMALALIADAGRSWEVVHVDFNNHIPQSSATFEAGMRISSRGAASRFVPFAPVIDCRPDRPSAVESLRNAIYAAHRAGDRLTVLLAGPPDTLWSALQGVPTTVRSNVRVISHSSPYNESTGGVHTLAQCTGVKKQFIPNQNARLNTKQNWSPWHRLERSDDENDSWVYYRMVASGRADVSDAGMAYFLLYGNDRPTPANLCDALTL